VSITGTLFRSARLSATCRAVFNGRVVERLFNIAIGRTAGRLLGRLWQ
jgi:hypothetical protein